MSLGDNWRLHFKIFEVIQSIALPATIDRFATAQNALLPKFNSLFFEPGTHGVDAFAQIDYLCEVNFIHPPFSIVGRTLAFLN